MTALLGLLNHVKRLHGHWGVNTDHCKLFAAEKLCSIKATKGLSFLHASIRDKLKFANQMGLHFVQKIRNVHSKLDNLAFTPGVVNRTFENRTQSNSIELNPWIEFDWVRQSNEIEHHTFSEFDFRTNRIQSNKSNSIELNPSDWVRLSSETELNRTQLNGFRSIGSGESIQREP